MSFKDKYKDHWEVANKREQAFYSPLSTFGYDLEPYGFYAESDEYAPGSPKESGIPDYHVKDTNKYIEVTGTDKDVNPLSPVWVRPDKVEYAKRHPDQTVILVHCLDQYFFTRWIYMLEVGKFPIENKLGNERYHIIPAIAMKELKQKKVGE